ncbi:hypothetical protein HNP86_001805 [Methanococcus maripaludis]|uniref:Uncharacterized protein n=1 Tax=Methanococcus maripaludis TaxID=39152 RepID=A0A7J9P0T5_METMI|nr:hypothetical protein [Methanococcus maripaludis]MBA2851646.1 hypothetical protein [Methanococcus maripaludis]
MAKVNARYIATGLVKVEVPDELLNPGMSDQLAEYVDAVIDNMSSDELLEGLRCTTVPDIADGIFDVTPTVECIEDSETTDILMLSETWEEYLEYDSGLKVYKDRL